MCQRLAIAKAHALTEKYSQHLIIGSDQVATFNGKIIGKPITHVNAVQQLTDFSGHTVAFYTGLCLLNTVTGVFQHHVECFKVDFRVLSTEQIERYLQAEQPYQCAGSFKSEGLGICLFERLEGNDPIDAASHWTGNMFINAHVRWAIIAIQQGERHVSGQEPSLELALTAHIVPELELEILRMTLNHA